MQITIRGHHLTITPAIEENIKAKFSQMTKHLDHVNSMQIKLAKDHQIDKRSHKGSAIRYSPMSRPNNHKIKIELG